MPDPKPIPQRGVPSKRFILILQTVIITIGFLFFALAAWLLYLSTRPTVASGQRPSNSTVHESWVIAFVGIAVSTILIGPIQDYVFRRFGKQRGRRLMIIAGIVIFVLAIALALWNLHRQNNLILPPAQ